LKYPEENYVAEFICSVAQGLNEKECCRCRCFDDHRYIPNMTNQHRNEEEKLKCERQQKRKYDLYYAFRYLNALDCRDWGYLWSHVNPETLGQEEGFNEPYYVDMEEYDLPFI
jgi:hypothetical protein